MFEENKLILKEGHWRLFGQFEFGYLLRMAACGEMGESHAL